MILAWVSSRGLDNSARSIIARVGAKWNSRDSLSKQGKKPICISPWNGRFWFRFNGNFLTYETKTVSAGLHKEEVITITCFGRSAQVLKDLIEVCRIEYLKQGQNKISIFKNYGNFWKRTTTKDKRPLSTIIMSETQKTELVDDVKGFLDPETEAWYTKRGIPYRRGYLLYGPPGTGKSSLVSAVASEFDLDIRAVSIPSVDDKKLGELFSDLPERCVVLLEDIDAVETDRSLKSPNASGEKKGMLSLSGLLNTLDGVASRDGRILFMTTNHKDKLDDALIRPGRIDKKFEIKLADKNVTANLFRFIFGQSEHCNAQDNMSHAGTKLDANHATADKVSDAWLSLIKDPFRFFFRLDENRLTQRNVPDVRTKQRGDPVTRENVPDTGSDPISQLADDFAVKIPEYRFSTAQIMSHLLQYKHSPEDALKYTEHWITQNGKHAISRRQLSPENSRHLEDVLWMESRNKDKTAKNKMRRVERVSDLRRLIEP